MALKDTLARLFGRAGSKPPELPKQSVEHDGIDRMVFDDVKMDSPRFRRMVLENAPIIAPDVQEPPAPDFTNASTEEIAEWQAKVKLAREARDKADPYSGWEELARDLFYFYHHQRSPSVIEPGEMNPAYADHSKIMQAWAAQPDAADARNNTRDNEQMAAWAVMAGVEKLQDLAGDILSERFEKAQELQEQMQQAQDAMDELESMRERAREAREKGLPVPQQLVENIKGAVKDKRAAQQAAAQLAEQMPPAMTTALYEAIQESVAAAHEASKQGTPSFGQGFGQGEPVYESPEQALAIAEAWSQGMLRDIAQLYGRMFSDFHFRRAKRVVGGQDEIVDVEVGDELRRVTPGELAALADDDLEDDFYARYASRELLVYSTVGEEHAGRGPIGMVLDGSGSMAGERNVFARALFLTLLNVARREKRDCFLVEFSGANQTISHEFPAGRPLDAQEILDAASHFFGGGTVPINGIQRAVEIMTDAPIFKSADIVLISDGEAGFGAEDKRLRDWMAEKGIRRHGIGIGGSWGYLKQMCDNETLVSIHDMELTDPNAATSQLAVSLT